MSEADEYRRYLARQILVEDKTVTYRILSRALKVHVNTAKQMLYEFCQWQNDCNANSVHATYLIFGTRREDQDGPTDGADVEMSSSMPEPDPEMEQLSDPVHTSTLTLVEEANLKEALTKYEQVFSIHVYSIASHPSRDLQLLSDVHCQLGEQVPDVEPVDMPKAYGTIRNSKTKKRSRKGPRPVASAMVPAKVPSQKPALARPSSKATPIGEPKESKDSSAKASSSAKSDAKPTSSASQRSSGALMQSFAKAAARGSSKLKSKPEPAPKQEEAPVYAMSDDGADDDFVAQPKAPENGGSRKSRMERQAELRRMMDEEDEDTEEKVDTAADDDDTPMDSPIEEPTTELSQEPEKEKEQAGPEKEPAEVVSSSGDGRRRGRRRVMKKKQVVDDEGYFVTVQEAAWESFSEDETAASSQKKPKTITATPSSSASSTKTKKAAGKGQGNIMSFFTKK